MGQIADPGEKLMEHIPDVRPVGGEHRRQRAQMEQYVKKVRRRGKPRLTQQILRDGQMSGAGNGQKFRNALNDAQNDGGQQRQRLHSPLCHDASAVSAAGG